MKTATTSELRRKFARILGWVEKGQEVEITKRGRVIARFVPVTSVPGSEASEPPPGFKMPRFASSIKKLLEE